jgi:pyruvate/2-oxoglutarate dehydrogenase complex dihydrolipoamide dehydrogenase (E3) component
MSDYEYDLVAIGSGPAGQRAAIQAASLEYGALAEYGRADGAATSRSLVTGPVDGTESADPKA